MNAQLTLPTNKVTISPIGLRIDAELTADEWRALAEPIGQVACAIGFIVGDWLVYGLGLFGNEGFPERRVDPLSYEIAIAATGLDRSTLQNYAYVSRSIPYSRRTEKLSWEHHRLLAKLPGNDQERWIKLCVAEDEAGRRMSTRRLRKSLSLGRIATAQDLEPHPADKGIENHIPFVNRLVGWWRRMQQDRFLDTATREQREALKRDLEPVVSIYDQL